MWIFLNDAFLSVVQSRSSKGELLLRARKREDLQAFQFEYPIYHTPEADYPFRTYMRKDDFADLIATRIQLIDYSNFKDSVREPRRANAYSQVWSTMINDFQEVLSLFKWKEPSCPLHGGSKYKGECPVCKGLPTKPGEQV